jgi:hypothetical protein
MDFDAGLGLVDPIDDAIRQIRLPTVLWIMRIRGAG